jgi:hypothetical protein
VDNLPLINKRKDIFMGCERPGGPFAGLMRDMRIKFPPNWEGELPPVATRDELRTQILPAFGSRNLSEAEISEVLDYLEDYESKYYEVMGGVKRGNHYHRVCGGGSMVNGETGVFCSKCGKLPDLSPPACIRQL